MQCLDSDLMNDAIREPDKPRPFLPGPASSTAKGNRRTKAYTPSTAKFCDLSSTRVFLQNSLGDLSNSGPAVRPENEAGANGLPETTT